MPSLHVSVVVTATPGLNDHFIGPFLDTLFATTANAPFTLRVTLTDNAPGHGLGRRMLDRFPSIHLIENAVLRGYAANHNTALQSASADYYAVANDDLAFLPGGLARVIELLEQPAYARVGAAGMNLRNPDGTLQPSTYRFPGALRVLLAASGLRTLIPFSGVTALLARAVGRGRGRSRFWAHDRTMDVETFRGAIVVARHACVAEVGWMVEDTLLGGEETEWHRRMIDAGWRVLFIHDAPVVHHGSQTVRVRPELEGEFLKGLLAFVARHRSRGLYLLLRGLLIPVLALRWALALAGGTDARRRATLLLRTAWSWRGP